jgi:hypothetical protein
MGKARENVADKLLLLASVHTLPWIGYGTYDVEIGGDEDSRSGKDPPVHRFLMVHISSHQENRA